MNVKFKPYIVTALGRLLWRQKFCPLRHQSVSVIHIYNSVVCVQMYNIWTVPAINSTQYAKRLCQSRNCTSEHDFSNCITPERQLSHLNRRQLDRRHVGSLLHFLCLASPYPVPWITSFSWLRKTYACCLRNIVIKSYKRKILYSTCKSRVHGRIGKESPWL
jgi:hypothetical protein